jgi:hypothetical protein
MQLSARTVASLLGRLFGPSFSELPRFGRGDPGPGRKMESISGPLHDPWHAVMLDPQPLPPREFYALALADAHIHEFLISDRIATVYGGEVRERALNRSLSFVAELDEICPRWPKWPKRWPPPPPPPPARPPFSRNESRDEEMTATELFVFGSRLLGASEVIEEAKLRDALAGLGEKALKISTQR